MKEKRASKPASEEYQRFERAVRQILDVPKSEIHVNKWMRFSLAFVVLIISFPALAQEQGFVKPQLLLSEILQGMPKGDRQEVRVLTASFKPGDKTVFHTHRFPVTVYVLEGAFTLQVEGSQPDTVKSGQAMVMPAHVRMTGYNRSGTEPLQVVIFYVSDPDTPFLDQIH